MSEVELFFSFDLGTIVSDEYDRNVPAIKKAAIPLKTGEEYFTVPQR
jgi:hypothetical protein